MNLRNILIVGAVMFFLVGTSTAQAGWEKGSGRKGKRVEKILAQLNLTDEQKKQLEDNRQQHRDKAKSLFEQRKSYKEAIKAELMQTELNMDKVNEIHAQSKVLQSQMADERLNSVLKVRKILTPDQFKEFLTLMEKQKSGFRQKKKQDANK